MQSLYEQLEKMEMLDYGSTIPTEVVHQLLGIEVPEMGTLKQFREIELIELSEIDKVRNALLKQGKYLAGTKTGYRVLLPSENQKQVNLIIDSASRKLRRAQTLLVNTPGKLQSAQDNSAVRIEMMRSGLRSRFSGYGDRPSV